MKTKRCGKISKESYQELVEYKKGSSFYDRRKRKDKKCQK